MSGRAWVVGVAVCAAVVLVACGEKPQVQNASGKKVDAEPWTTSDVALPGYSAKGWKSSGDKTAWEEQIHQRNQSQNDYAR